MSGLVKPSLATVSVLMIVDPAFAQVFTSVTPLPGPATWAIVAAGLVGAALAVHRNRRK